MKKFPFKKRSLAYLISVAIASLFVVFAKGRSVDYQRVQVVKVIDGDTAQLSNGKSVRYIGIDCPETHRRTSAGWVNVSEPFGKEAVRLNEELVLGRAVRLEFDVTKHDKYDRLLAYCFVKQGDKEVFVQEELLRRGLAYLYTFPPNVKYVERFVAAFQGAKQKKIGVWSVDLTIPVAEVARFLGQRKMVVGKITRTSSGEKFVRLNMEGFRLIIFANDLSSFLNKGIDPSEYYKGKTVRVFGLIKDYRGAPEIIVSNPWQIEIVDQ